MGAKSQRSSLLEHPPLFVLTQKGVVSDMETRRGRRERTIEIKTGNKEHGLNL